MFIAEQLKHSRIHLLFVFLFYTFLGKGALKENHCVESSINQTAALPPYSKQENDEST